MVPYPNFMIQNQQIYPCFVFFFFFFLPLTHSERSEVDRDFRQFESAHMKGHDGWTNSLLDRF